MWKIFLAHRLYKNRSQAKFGSKTTVCWSKPESEGENVSIADEILKFAVSQAFSL